MSASEARRVSWQTRRAKYGSTGRRIEGPSAKERLLARTIEEDRGFSTACWCWQGGKNAAGYGQIYANGINVGAHRAMYEIARGKIPPGLTIDHLCYVRECINPDHLEVVERAENVRRQHQRATTCVRGHAIADHRQVLASGKRVCRLCDSIRHAESYRRRRDRLVASSHTAGDTL